MQLSQFIDEVFMQETASEVQGEIWRAEMLERTMDGYRRFQLFKLAQESGLFAWLEEQGAASMHRVIDAMQWSPQYGQALLTALQEEGYIEPAGNRVRAALPSVRHASVRLADMQAAWERLPAMLPAAGTARSASADRNAVWRGTRNASLERDQAAAAVLAWPDIGQARRLLDLGGTGGEVALVLCAACPQLHAEVLVERSARAALQRKLLDAGLEQRIALFERDLDSLDLQGSYDIALALHCFYPFPQAVLQTMETVSAHLRPGGLFVSQHSFEDGRSMAGMGAAERLERRILQSRAPLHYPDAYADRISSAGLQLLRTESATQGDFGNWLHLAQRTAA